MDFTEEDVKRFWLYVNRTDDCWEWTGARDEKGYGMFHFHGKLLRAHRFSYELFNGFISSSLMVCHKCDNSRCVRPSYLFMGTGSDNMQDAAGKRRAGLPPSAGRVLAKADVVAIRKAHARGESDHVLALRYHIRQTAVEHVVRRDYYDNISDEDTQPGTAIPPIAPRSSVTEHGVSGNFCHESDELAAEGFMEPPVCTMAQPPPQVPLPDATSRKH